LFDPPDFCIRLVNPHSSPISTFLQNTMIRNIHKPGDPGIMVRMEGEPGMRGNQL
jgi:hypothetical protein